MHTVVQKANPRRPLRWIACLMALCAALALPAAAVAGQARTDPTGAQYADSLTGAVTGAGDTSGAGDTNGVPTGSASNGAAGDAGGGAVGGLPFTGTDLIALAAVALCLISTGLVFQRLARNQ